MKATSRPSMHATASEEPKALSSDATTTAGTSTTTNASAVMDPMPGGRARCPAHAIAAAAVREGPSYSRIVP